MDRTRVMHCATQLFVILPHAVDVWYAHVNKYRH